MRYTVSVGAGKGKAKRAQTTVAEFYQEHPPEQILADLNADAPDPSVLAALPIERLARVVSEQRDAQVATLVHRMYHTAIGNWVDGKFVPVLTPVRTDLVADRFIHDG